MRVQTQTSRSLLGTLGILPNRTHPLLIRRWAAGSLPYAHRASHMYMGSMSQSVCVFLLRHMRAKSGGYSSAKPHLGPLKVLRPQTVPAHTRSLWQVEVAVGSLH